ncbi:MAG: hypothetical protein RIC56_08610 [Pseudomonadales bacterium]
MSGIDMFCAADDQHRVVLLVDLLQRAGQRVELRPEPTPEPTDPCLVACTRRALAEPWIAELFARGTDVVAVRLDGTPLPGPCARSIDMQNWPARSADRQVAALVGWLLQHGSGAASVEVAGLASGSRLEADRHVPVRRRRQRSSDSVRALLVLVVLVLGGGLLWLSAPEPGSRDHDEAATSIMLDSPALAPVSGDGPGGAAAASSEIGSVAAGAASSPPPAEPTAAEPAPAEPTPAGPPADQPRPEQAPAQPPAPLSAQPAAAPPPQTADALAHLCNARSVAAARAWAAALNWKQRRRLPDEPCVRRLLERPGFSELEELVEVP